MNVQAAQAAEPSISKAEFARRRNVSPGRVSQWLSEGKIDATAIDGEGRNAKIIESVALRQLNERLHVDQRFGNGLTTRLDHLPAAAPQQGGAVLPFAPQPPSKPVDTGPDTIEKQIARARLEGLERENRKKAEEEAARAGLLTDASDVSRQMGKVASALVAVYEAAIPEFAAAIAAKYNLPQRDLVHLLRGESRKARTAAAQTFRHAVGSMPAHVSFEIVSEEQDPATTADA